MNNPRTGEGRMVMTLIAVSVMVHLFVYLFMTPGLMRTPMPMYEEWEIEAQLVADVDMSAPDKDTLPNAEEKEEAKVPETLLPQLPKKFEIDDKAKGETVAEEGEESKDEKTDQLAEKKEDEKAQQKQNEEEKNRLQKDDAIRRLAIERLRQEQKFSSKMEAEKRDAIARLKEKAASNKDVNVGAMGNLGAGKDKYLSKIQVHVHRCYSWPAAYKLENANMMVAIAIVLNEQGGLVSSMVEGPSGDQVFDQEALEGLRKCSPLPPPPEELAGTKITLNFKP